MAISLESLRKVRADKPPRVLIYGPAGIGKTTLASEFPEPIFLQVEEGTPGDVEINTFGLLPTYQAVMEAIGLIYDNNLPFSTVVLDSATEMQRLVFAETCARGDEKGHAKQNIEDFGYGKGYTYAERIWRELIEAFEMLRRDRGMAVVMLGHSRIERFDDPETVSYDRYEIDLHAKSKGPIERDMDAILLLKSPVTIQKEEQGFNKDRNRAEGGSQVWIHATPKPAFVAKNRYGIPSKFPYKRGEGFKELSKYFPAWSAPADARTLSEQADAA